MKKTCAFIICLLCTIATYAQDCTVTTFILVRHAEKGSDNPDDPDLNPEGTERSKKLAALLIRTPINAVYSTKYKRTKNTVTPLAQEKGLHVHVYEAGKSGPIEAMLAKHTGETILVAGHSNTVPQIANLLTGTDDFETFTDSDYGNILIVSVVEKGKVSKVTWLTY